MKVSIITVCKNSEKTIERTIQGVLSQTYNDIEYIIIDGDSSDRTKDIIRQYTNHITRFISEPDRGIYEAMNKGINLATGSFFYFSNSDDYLFDANVIQDLVQFVSHHPGCDFVYGDHEARFISGDSKIYKPVLPEQLLEEMVCLGDDRVHQPTSLFKADLFKKVGLFSETYRIASDYEWFLRLLQDPTLKICYYPRTIVSYAHGGASGNIRALFEEVFDIQNKIALCQREDWLIKRVVKLQQMFVDKYELLESTHKLAIARESQIQSLEANLTANPGSKISTLKAKISALELRIADLESVIEAMKTSKFWKLRSVWFRVKRILGLTTEES